MEDLRSLPLEEMLETAEGILQGFLRNKCPPNYVARVLDKSSSPDDAEAWSKTIQEFGGSEILEAVDAINLSEPSISILNRQVFKCQIDQLDEAIEVLRSVCHEPSRFESASQEARGVECLSYLLTERGLGWLRSTSDGWTLNPDNPQLLLALDYSELALKLALRCNDFFRASRSSFNIGRIHCDAGLSPQVLDSLSGGAESAHVGWFNEAAEAILNPQRRIRRELAIRPLFASLHYIVQSRACNNAPLDDHRHLRRIEALNRLIDLATRNPNTLHLVPTLVEYLKVPVLSLKIARRLLAQPSEGQGMVAIENSVPAVNFDLGAIARLLGAETALFSYAILETMVSLTVIQGGKVTCKALDPSRAGAFWDRFFKPTGAQFERFRGGGKDPELYWKFSMDVLHLTPKSGDRWSTELLLDNSILDSNSGWQNALYDVLIAPFEAELLRAGVKHLVFMTDLALMLIPLHLLTDSAGVTVGQRYSVSYCPSFALLADALSRQTSAQVAESVLIVADPTETLKFVPWERALIASIFQPDRVRVLDTSNATCEALAAAVRDADIVHFATHGRFDSMDVARSGLALRSEQWLTLSDMQELTFKDGALVCLSACETARLKLVSRSTPLGIVPSILEGGASTVIATFWKVNDLSTALVAARFYDNWLVRKLSKLDSLIDSTQWVQSLSVEQVSKLSQGPVDIRTLRSMQLPASEHTRGIGRTEMLAQRPFTHDYYWGPFALYGAWI